jgi:hypothetical protein
VLEVVEDKKQALLVYSKKNKVADYIKQKLQNSFDVYETTNTHGESFLEKSYDLVVYVGVFSSRPELLRTNKLTIFFYFYSSHEYAERKKWCERNLINYKIVNIGRTDKKPHELIDFVLFKTPIPYSFDFSTKLIPRAIVHKEVRPKDVLVWSLKIGALLVVLSNLLYFALFAYEWFGLWRLWQKRGDSYATISKQAGEIRAIQQIEMQLAFIPSNTLFWVPGIEPVFGFVTTTHNTINTLSEGLGLVENYSALSRLFLKRNKTDAERKEAQLRIAFVQKNTRGFVSDYTQVLNRWKKTDLLVFNKLKEEYVNKLGKYQEHLSILNQVNSRLPELLALSKPQKILLLFMNNMELRPGGGFIGSVGTAEFADFSLKNLVMYDVYTLDGQLKAHIEPPEAIRRILDQPHWFLRDSAFSADFSTNANQALQFVKTEVGWEGFDGVVGVTFSAVQRMLDLFPDLYISGYDESVTSENFFNKAQSHAEQGFFPGSQEKKNFLEAVFRSVITRLHEGDFDTLKFIQIVRAALDEKMVVGYFSDSQIQNMFDDLFWTGRLVRLGCTIEQDCYYDYMSIIDANLGVNKANFFIQRTAHLTTRITTGRDVRNSLVIDYLNQSQPNIFPGGLYKNYLQVLLPSDAQIDKIAVNGKVRTDFSLSTEMGFNKIGILIEVYPQEKVTVSLDYFLQRKLINTKNYEIVIQKQTGSLNNDLIYEMHTEGDLQILQTNFQPVVDTNSFVYNTFLEKDRLLLVTFK